MIEPFDQNQAEAPTGGTASGNHREPPPVLPQLATETLTRAPGPWCVARGALGPALYARDRAFQPRLKAMGAFLGGPYFLGLGTSSGLVGKGPGPHKEAGSPYFCNPFVTQR